MLKLIRNWKFVFLATLFILYILYFSVSYQDELELPSEGWSRNLSITQFKVDNLNEIILNNNIFTLPIIDENTFINFWFDENTINYSVINSEGTHLSTDKLNLNIDSLKKVRGVENNNVISLYSLESKKLKRYEFDYKTKDILSSQTIAEPVRDFIVNKDLLIYSSDNFLNIIDTSGHSEQIENINVEKFEIVNDSNPNLYHIAFCEKNAPGNKLINYMTYDLENKKINMNKITPVASSINMSLDGFDIGIVNNNINIFASISDKKFGTNTLYLIKFPQNDVSSFSKKSIAIDSSRPNPRILKDKKEILTFIASVNVIKGKEKETINLVKYTLDENNNISNKQLLTKTNTLSQNPYYFKLNNHNYLVWTDIKGNNKRIFFSSNDNEIVKNSLKLSSFEILDLFMATITSLIPSSLISAIPLLYIFAPTILAIFIISLINLKWIEHYSLKRFSIILLIHLILKILYSNSNILNNYEIVNFLPIFLKNPFIFYTLLVLTTLISLYCTVVYYKNSNQNIHLVKLYSLYAFIDLVIYCFLTVPYVYSYLLFTYKLNIY